MSNLRLVYTPETNYFTREFMSEHRNCNPFDERSVTQQRSFAQLREVFPDLPNAVGIITCDSILKSEQPWFKQDNSRGVELVYPPLDILLRIQELAQEDLEDNPLLRESISREISYLGVHPGLVLGDDISSLGGSPPGVSILPTLNKCITYWEEFLQREDLPTGWRRDLERIVSKGDLGILEGLERRIDFTRRKFDANRVTYGFPLNYIPVTNSTGSIVHCLEVSLEDRHDILVEDAAKTLGTTELPNGQLDLEGLSPQSESIAGFSIRDLNGYTRPVSFKRLLDTLPEPRTVITDLFVVDHFPELTDMGFDPYEFKLEAAA
jgi:hypothetical protein